MCSQEPQKYTTFTPLIGQPNITDLTPDIISRCERPETLKIGSLLWTIPLLVS